MQSDFQSRAKAILVPEAPQAALERTSGSMTRQTILGHRRPMSELWVGFGPSDLPSAKRGILGPELNVATPEKRISGSMTRGAILGHRKPTLEVLPEKVRSVFLSAERAI